MPSYQHTRFERTLLGYGFEKSCASEAELLDALLILLKNEKSRNLRLLSLLIKDSVAMQETVTNLLLLASRIQALEEKVANRV